MNHLDLHTAALFLLMNIVGAADESSASLQISCAEKVTEGTVAENLVGGINFCLGEKLRLHEMIKIHPPFSIRALGEPCRSSAAWPR